VVRAEPPTLLLLQLLLGCNQQCNCLYVTPA